MIEHPASKPLHGSEQKTAKRRSGGGITLFLLVLLLVSGCGSLNVNVPKIVAPDGLSQLFSTDSVTPCPAELRQNPSCYSPQTLRQVYSVTPLIDQGFTGKGQTIIIISELTSPDIQSDINTFDQAFGLPDITPQIFSPSGTLPFNPNNQNDAQAAAESDLDVEVAHSFAPGASIDIVQGPDLVTSEQYAVNQHLGQIVSQSFGVNETNPSASSFISSLDSMFQQATLNQGMTFLASTGDFGASGGPNDTTPGVQFPASDPWVTAVGGTTLSVSGTNYFESAWNDSGGGISSFFSEPSYQKQYLPAQVQAELKGFRGIPDISGDADPSTAMACFVLGQWQQCGGTSESAPMWAGIVAIANQVAGHPLGFLNPRLYKLGTENQGDYRDITSGDNSVHTQGLDVNGYSATTGWDAVTGWGVPLSYQLAGDLTAITG
jgi:subtilase family serine protease